MDYRGHRWLLRWPAPGSRCAKFLAMDPSQLTGTSVEPDEAVWNQRRRSFARVSFEVLKNGSAVS